MVEWLDRWPPLRPVLAAVLAFLFGAQLVAVFTVGDDEDGRPTRVATGATTTSTSIQDPSAVTTSPGVATTLTTVRAGGTTPPTAAPAAAPFAGPKPGEYRYRVDSKITEDDETTDEKYDAQLVITAVGGGRLRHRFMEQGGVAAVDDLVWRADGRYIVATDGGDGSAGCDLEPDIRTAPHPATPGTTSQFKTSCTVRDEGDPEPYTVVLSGTFRVLGNERRSVGGTQVDVAHFRVEFADDDPSDGPDTTVLDEFYAPALGLTIEETQHSYGSGEYEDGETYTYDELSTRRLVSLQPV